jgi:hypothetical protein
MPNALISPGSAGTGWLRSQSIFAWDFRRQPISTTETWTDGREFAFVWRSASSGAIEVSSS